MKAYHLLAAATLLSLSVGAMAKDKDKDKDVAPQDKKVCKSEKVTGSLTKVNRICMTQGEWDRMRDTTRGDLNRMDQNASRFEARPVGGLGGGGG